VDNRTGKYLTFRVARQGFAMDVASIRGFLPLHDLASVEPPHVWLRGFAALGGRDFPVIDLRSKLGLAHGTHGPQACIVVVETEAEDGPRLAGFVADRVSEVIELRARDIRNGIARPRGRPRRVLDADQILTGAELVSLMARSR
jgi:purine-binding chemotaxis protein CheW